MQKIYLIAFILITLFIPALAANLADDSTAQDNTQVFHVYNDIDMVSTLKFEYGRPRIVIKAVYPQLESDVVKECVETFNQLVVELVQEKIAEYRKQVAENQDYQKNLPKKELKNNLYIDYSASFVQSGQYPILSIRFNVQGYIAGMAHPYHQHFVLNYDLSNNNQIDLEDLFKPDENYLVVLSNYTSGVLYKRLPNRNMVTEGTAPTPTNFKNWNVKSNGLLFTFDEARVAPYVYGAQTVLVPYSILKSIVDNDAPIANCVKRKGRCSRNNLLTGGFIDEARNLRSIDSNHRLLNPTLGKL